MTTCCFTNVPALCMCIRPHDNCSCHTNYGSEELKKRFYTQLASMTDKIDNVKGTKRKIKKILSSIL